VANTLTAVIPKLLAQGIMTLRQQAIMPRLVNRSYETLAGQRGSTIDVPVPSAVQAQEVTPSNAQPANIDFTPTSVPLAMNQWYESRFQLSDKDMLEAMAGTIPMQAAEAIKALGNKVDQSILALYKDIPYFTGTPGTTPFAANVSDFTNAMVILDENLSPVDDRRVMLSPAAQGNALKLPEFLLAYARGDQGGIIRGQIGTKMGSDWYMDQNIPTHVSTPLTAGAATVNGAHAVGVTSVSIAKATNASPLVAGDILTFAGDTQTYVVTADVNLAVGNTAVGIYPALQVALAGNEAVTLKASHVANLHFHRDAFALASRPLVDVADGLGNQIQSAVDPVTGLVLRLEVSRQYKQTTFSYDILWGVKTIRKELAVRIAG